MYTHLPTPHTHFICIFFFKVFASYLGLHFQVTWNTFFNMAQVCDLFYFFQIQETHCPHSNFEKPIFPTHL